ncbi:DUF29 family protein [Roseomonas sp. CCTCC AB2023176]|uniref:DUF29 family protein n=1 Tax=Roseomonas sp. CCTCC AB2023176 TaxID=3342640 RepID=UPI0035DCF608
MNDLDRENVIEEIEGSGRGEVRAVQSLFEKGITHALTVVAWPGSLAVSHWTDEAWNFLGDARRRLEPSTIRRLSAEEMYAPALRDVHRLRRTHSELPRPLPALAPFTLDELRDEDFIAQDMIARIRDAAPAV